MWMKETILHGCTCFLQIYLCVSVINSVMNLVTAVLISMHCKFCLNATLIILLNLLAYIKKFDRFCQLTRKLAVNDKILLISMFALNKSLSLASKS